MSAAYMNGMRLDLSVQRLAVEGIANALGAGSEGRPLNVIAEAQLVQLNSLVENTRRNAEAAEEIHGLLVDVVNGVRSVSVE